MNLESLGIMSSHVNQRFHFGVYGVARHNGQVLVVHKNRGLYKDLFDLPGGRPEHGEGIKDALKREFFEETGIVIRSFSFLKNFSHLVSYTDQDGVQIELHHLGVIYLVHNVNPAEHNPSIALEDVKGSSWVDEDQLTIDSCSPLVIEGISVL